MKLRNLPSAREFLKRDVTAWICANEDHQAAPGQRGYRE
jgi:hypothetical protein